MFDNDGVSSDDRWLVSSPWPAAPRERERQLPYGDGKTHLMKLFRARALNENFAVSYVVLSTNTPLNRWDLLYRGLVTQIYAKSRPDRPGVAAVLDP